MLAALLLALLSAAPRRRFPRPAPPPWTSRPRSARRWPAITPRGSREGVHDPLYAKAVVLETRRQEGGARRLDLISTTARWWTRPAGRSRRPPASPARRDDLRHPRPHRARAPGPGAARGRLRRQEPARAASTARNSPARSPRRSGGPRRPLRPAQVAAAHGQRVVDRLQPPVPHGRRHGRLEPRQAQPEDRQARRRRSTPTWPSSTSRPPTRTEAAGRLRQLRRAPRQRRRRAVLRRLPATVADLLGRFKGPDMVTSTRPAAAATSTTST